MGIVWLAESEAGENVAVKLITPHMTRDRLAVSRFRREADATLQIQHCNIAAVLDSGEIEGLEYLVMEYVDGVSLEAVVRRLAGSEPSSLTVDALAHALVLERQGMADAAAILKDSATTYVHAIVAWARDIALGLEHAHRLGIVHRDIKPSNVLVDRSGSVRIIDFGLAMIQGATRLTRTNAFIGTLKYSAPEAVSDRLRKPDDSGADRRVDVYGVGIILYEFLALCSPFAGEDMLALAKSIATEPPVDLRKHHRGLSRDVAMVVEKCLKKRPEERYGAAQDLAEDLKRFLDGRRVLARPPSVLRKVASWARRKPGSAATLGLLFLVLALLWPAIDYVKRSQAEGQARSERELARRAMDDFRATNQAFLDACRAYGSIPATIDYSATRAQEERRIHDLRLKQVLLLEDVRSALERSARIEQRFGGVSNATRKATLEYYLFRYERALAARDPVQAELFERRVLDLDPSYEAVVEGRATLRVVTRPPRATVYLFRHEDREGIPRLVPVPHTGTTPCRSGEWVPGFAPGTTCLRVVSAAKGSVADRAGVTRGDLVLRIQNLACEDGTFVRAVAPGSVADRAGIRPWDRVIQIGERRIHRPSDWHQAMRAPPASWFWVDVGSQRFQPATGRSLETALGVETCDAEDVFSLPAPEGGGALSLLRDGKPLHVMVPEGEATGLECEPTANPLILSPENQIESGVDLPCVPGGYLLYVRKPGWEDQRYPVWVPRNGAVSITVTLLEEGTTPECAVWIPGGRCVVAEGPENWWFDPRRQLAELRKEIDVPGFFIRRTELMNREWFEFVNDPVILERIEEAMKHGEVKYVPRHYNQPGQLLAQRQADGRYAPMGSWDAPVRGVSGKDVLDFVAWRNARSQTHAEDWLMAVPSSLQWMRAASGADGRDFPWGNRFDMALCRGDQPPALPDAPSRFEVRDESPFGIFDMAGSRREWTEGGTILKGGSWGDGDRRFYYIGFGDGLGMGYVNQTCGFRPVLIPRTPAR